MTVTTANRVPLGQIDVLAGAAATDDTLIGQILYIQPEHYIVVPLDSHGSQHWCAVIADLDGRRPEYMNVPTADLEGRGAWREVDPTSVDPEMHLVAWYARLAVAMWSDPRWPTMREAARLTRVPGSANLAFYHAKTMEVLAATGAGIDTLRRLVDELADAGFLERCPDTPSSVGASLGTFHTAAPNLPQWSPVRGA